MPRDYLTGWGEDASLLLAEAGYPTREPTLRSSDLATAMSDPFMYYLTRRLGLADPFRWSRALNYGTWFHKLFEFYDEPIDRAKDMAIQFFLLRKTELEETLAEQQVLPEHHAAFIDREKQTFEMACALFETLYELRVPGLHGKTLIQWLNEDRWRCLGREMALTHRGGQIPWVIQPDLLLLDQSTNKLWVIDPKTCTEAPETRLQTCPIEFQTLHYLNVLQVMLDRGELEEYGPVSVGGMIHVAIQKPPITFGTKDRPYRDYEHELQRGPRAGQIEIRREYLSQEPQYELYVERCKRWLKAEDEYTHLQPEREAHPVVNVSTVPAVMATQGMGWIQWDEGINCVSRLATQDPWPGLFLKGVHTLRNNGRISTYAPFYLNPPSEWPGIIREQGLVQRWRDLI